MTTFYADFVSADAGCGDVTVTFSRLSHRGVAEEISVTMSWMLAKELYDVVANQLEKIELITGQEVTSRTEYLKQARGVA